MRVIGFQTTGAGVSHASAAKPSPSAPSNNAEPLPSKANWYVRRMVGEVRGQKRKLVGNVVLRQRLFMDGRLALPAEPALKK